MYMPFLSFSCWRIFVITPNDLAVIGFSDCFCDNTILSARFSCTMRGAMHESNTSSRAWEDFLSDKSTHFFKLGNNTASDRSKTATFNLVQTQGIILNYFLVSVVVSLKV